MGAKNAKGRATRSLLKGKIQCFIWLNTASA
jgi:hypothetical protein